MRYIQYIAVLLYLGGLACTKPIPKPETSFVRAIPLIIELEEPLSGRKGPVFRVQVLATEDRELAKGKVRELQVLQNEKVFVLHDQPVWKVMVGETRTQEKADRLKKELIELGYQDVRVVTFDKTRNNQ